VEGAELLVLRGAARTIDESRPLVFCELYDEYCRCYGYSAADVFDFFAGRSYRSMAFDGRAFRPIDRSAYGGAGDVLFVPREIAADIPCG
jgi:hypothetical protein